MMTPIQDRLTGQLRQHADNAEHYEIRAYADEIVELLTVAFVQEVVVAIQQLPEQNATKGMDFGRGYALACKDIKGLLAVLAQC